jgi:hypothetical protein
MSREGDLMRNALRRRFVPAITGRGFIGSGSTFRRVDPRWLDLVTIQYWKYGGQFILEFARLARNEPRLLAPVASEGEIGIEHVLPRQRARLEQREDADADGFRGFRFGGFGEEKNRYEALADQVVELLPQVDAWLESGIRGSHIFDWK